MAFALTGARIFDGENISGGLAVVIDGGRIAEVVPEEKLASGIERRIFERRTSGARIHRCAGERRRRRLAQR